MAHDQHTAVQHEAPDAWHNHEADVKPQESHAENIDSKSVFFFGFAGFIFIVGAVLAIIVYFFWYSNTLMRQNEQFGEGTVKAMGVHQAALDEHDAQLARLKSTDLQVTRPDTGTLRVNIDRAMQKVEANYGKK